MNKKVVWLPYDMDTALGINNSGLLTFSYNLEDTDLQEGGEFIFNGQDSVMWTNLRDAFGDQIKSMYQQLRSERVLSYDVVEQMFEEHQSKWPEAIFNEDSFYKYLEPLINDNDGTYLGMLQGSKAEQRKWWLYNRFRYMDSKYNAGDALTDTIMMRSYAVGDISITPYADIYATTAWDGELTQVRASKGQTYVLPCPKDSANDAVVAIYSASQLADIGDLSVLKIKSGDFSRGTKLQSLKVGDADENYSNTNLISLSLGNNTLLKTLDVRNCPNLATTITLTGCSNIEEVYFDGTSITGVELPNGGILHTLHLPGTITNLTIRNQPDLEDLTVPDYSHISTLWLENAGIASDLAKTILDDILSGSRVRLTGFNWNMASEIELAALVEKLSTLRGLDETGGNMNQAQMQGSIHVPKIYADSAAIIGEYPYIDLTYDEMGSYLYDAIIDNQYSPFLLENFNEGGPNFSMSPNAFNNVTTINKVCIHNCYDFPSQCFRSSSVTEFVLNSPNITNCSISNYTFQQCRQLTKVKVICPHVTLYNYAFNDCPALEIIEFTGSIRFYHANIFNANNTGLKALVIRSTSVMSETGATIFDSLITDADNLQFHVYVPSSMINQFTSSSTNWVTINTKYPGIYRVLEDYTVDGTVTGDIDISLI